MREVIKTKERKCCDSGPVYPGRKQNNQREGVKAG